MKARVWGIDGITLTGENTVLRGKPLNASLLLPRTARRHSIIKVFFIPRDEFFFVGINSCPALSTSLLQLLPLCECLEIYGPPKSAPALEADDIITQRYVTTVCRMFLWSLVT